MFSDCAFRLIFSKKPLAGEADSVSLAILPSPMNALGQKRAWFWVAIAAIAIAFFALLVPHVGNSLDQPVWLALLPVFFIGLIAPLCPLLILLLALSLVRAPAAPVLAPSFQRPPPSRA
jgi:hypothetical protein